MDLVFGRPTILGLKVLQHPEKCKYQVSEMAEDCLLAQLIEGLLTRKLPLKSVTPAGEFDSEQTLSLPYFKSFLHHEGPHWLFVGIE